MRPLSIRLQNFGSHRDTTLDLTGIPSLCLTGDTGAGKSRLVYAMAWCLWGEVPGGADQAVRTGATSTTVTQTLEAHGHVYRITRSRKINGRGSSSLELEAQDALCPSGWRSETGANIRDTQARIEAIVGQYDLSRATWLSLQGETDHITRATAGDRSAILGRLLGLDKYDDLRVHARDMMRKDEATLEAVRPQREALEAVAATQLARSTDVGMAGHALVEAQAGETRAAQDVEAAAAAAAELRAVHDQVRAARTTHSAAVEAVRAAEARKTARWNAAEAADREVHQIEQQAHAWTPGDDAQLEQARQDEAETAAQIDAVRAQGEAAADRKREAEAAVATAEQAIKDANTEAATAWHASRSTVSDRVRSAEQAETDARARIEQAERALTDAQRAVRDEWTTRRSTLQQARAEADQAVARTSADVAAAERRLEQLRADTRTEWQRQRGAAQTRQAHAFAAHKAASVAVDSTRRDAGLIGEVPCKGEGVFSGCKLLAGAVARRTDLPGLEATLTTATAELAAADAALAALSTPPDPPADVLAPLEAALQTARETADTAGQAQARARANVEDHGTQPPMLAPGVSNPLVTAIEFARETSSAATRRADEARRSLAMLGTTPPGADPDTMEPLEVNLSRARIAVSDAVAERDRCAAVYRDTSAHLATIRTRIRDLETRRDAGAGTAARIAEAQARLDSARAELATATEEVARLDADRDALVPAAQLARDLYTEAVAADARIRTATTARDEAIRAVAQAEGRVRDAERILAEADQAVADLAALDASTAGVRRHLADLGTLAQAYQDVPRLILETVIPDIEATANRLLARISSTGIAIELRTQRALKSDATRIAETLDIVVRDRVGERVYECYSGGERFEIDLALRVALTQVLSARAGLDLRTFVIDEGFGTQDAARVQAIASELGTIAAMFGLCIVISHVPGLADSMPHEVHVEKDARGVSSIEWLSGAAASAA